MCARFTFGATKVAQWETESHSLNTCYHLFLFCKALKQVCQIYPVPCASSRPWAGSSQGYGVIAAEQATAAAEWAAVGPATVHPQGQ